MIYRRSEFGGGVSFRERRSAAVTSFNVSVLGPEYSPIGMLRSADRAYNRGTAALLGDRLV
jgi:hypothetical protein